MLSNAWELLVHNEIYSTICVLCVPMNQYWHAVGHTFLKWSWMSLHWVMLTLYFLYLFPSVLLILPSLIISQIQNLLILSLPWHSLILPWFKNPIIWRYIQNISPCPFYPPWPLTIKSFTVGSEKSWSRSRGNTWFVVVIHFCSEKRK